MFLQDRVFDLVEDQVGNLFIGKEPQFLYVLVRDTVRLSFSSGGLPPTKGPFTNPRKRKYLIFILSPPFLRGVCRRPEIKCVWLAFSIKILSL